MERRFELVSPFAPTGDQPEAIEQLLRGLATGDRFQTLLGATGTGKTFTMANVIARSQRPTLIMSHNKTLAAQLYEEMRQLFPHNAVSYFVSYYDYYQPEAYIPQRTSSSRRMPRGTRTWTGCGWRRRATCSRAPTRSWSRACRASTAWVRHTST